MMHRFPSFVDLQPQVSSGDNIPMQQDYELYPSESESYVNPMIHQSLAEPRHNLPTKSLAMFSSTPWPENAVRPDQVASLPMEIGLHPAMPHFSPPSWSGNLSSTSGAESPRSSNGSWWNVGCYSSPPYSCDDTVLQTQDFWDSPSPSVPVDLEHSLAHPQVVQDYPEPEPIVELERDSGYTMVQPVTPSLMQQHGEPDLGRPLSNLPYSEPIASQASVCSSPNPLPPSPQASRKKPGKASTTRVNKRTTRKKAPHKTGPTSAPGSVPKTKATSKKAAAAASRMFVCSFSHYGCPSTFVSKNEWKRHVTSQHVQLGFYRCDVGRCNLNNPSNYKGPSDQDSSSCEEVRLVNDFNRKDLFTQHQRRMHAPWAKKNRKHPVTDEERNEFELSLEDVRARCWYEQRKAPSRSRCGFCAHVFTGSRSWNDRMEHVGRHFEKGDIPLEAEVEDIPLREWAIEEGIVRWVAGQWKLTSLCEK